MFSSVEEALDSAYLWEARASSRNSSAVLSGMRGGSVRGPRTMAPEDWVAQAGLTQRVARQNLNPKHWRLVQARWTVPADRDLRKRKLDYTEDVGHDWRCLHEQIPAGFYWEVVRVWCGVTDRTPDLVLARRYGVSHQTVFNWRRNLGRSRRKIGIEAMLELEKFRALSALQEPFERAEFVWPKRDGGG